MHRRVVVSYVGSGREVRGWGGGGGGSEWLHTTCSACRCIVIIAIKFGFVLQHAYYAL